MELKQIKVTDLLYLISHEKDYNNGYRYALNIINNDEDQGDINLYFSMEEIEDMIEKLKELIKWNIKNINYFAQPLV